MPAFVIAEQQQIDDYENEIISIIDWRFGIPRCYNL
jgi:hypothetical protein